MLQQCRRTLRAVLTIVSLLSLPTILEAMSSEINLEIGSMAMDCHEFETPLAFGEPAETTFLTVLSITPGTADDYTMTLGIQDRPKVEVPARTGEVVEIEEAMISLTDEIANGLTRIRLEQSDSQVDKTWQLCISNEGELTNFYGMIAHDQDATFVPRIALAIGSELDPDPPRLDFEETNLMRRKVRSVEVLNIGTGNFEFSVIDTDPGQRLHYLGA